MMVGIIYSLVISWVIFLTWYVFRNGFAHESIEVFFPALGAILLSFFLAYKAIVVDGPRLKVTTFPVVMMHIPSTGSLVSPFRQTVGDTSPKFIISSRGLSELDSITHRVKLQSLSLSTTFQKVNPENKLSFYQENQDLLLELLEFVIVEFMSANQVPSWLNEEELTWGISGGGGGIRSKVGKDMDITVVLDEKSIPKNRFLKLNPIEIHLPSSASILAVSNGPNRSLKIDTTYSTVDVSINLAGAALFDPRPDWLTSEIGRQWGITTPDVAQSYTFSVNVKTYIKPFSRHSPEAKLHAEWLEKLSTRLSSEFSFEEIRKRLEDRRANVHMSAFESRPK